MGAGRLFHFLVAMPTSEDLFISAKHLLIYRSMYALADASGASAIDANHPPGWARRQKDSARPTRTAPPKATSGILSLRSPNRLWRTRRKSALFPHCCRIATFFVCSLDAALPLLILQHARKKIFVSNNTDKKNIVSDKCHKLSFYFDLYRVPEIVTRGRFPDGGESDSHGEPRRLVMSAPTPLRQDFDASQLRGLARKTKDGPQA